MNLSILACIDCQWNDWFVWNINQGVSFPYPHIEAAAFRESDKSYVRRPFIWNSTFAYQYGAVALNQLGLLGISLFRGDKRTFGSKMGELYQGQTLHPFKMTWVATGYTLQGGSAGSNADPRYIEFGKQLDHVVPLDEALDNTVLNFTT